MRKKQEGVKTEKLVKSIVDAILDKKGNNVVSLNISKLPNAVCKYFVLCNADSTTQVDAIAGNVEDKIIENHGEKVWQSAGYDNSYWIILDYVDVVVHIFQTEARLFYRLEELWADADSKHYTDDNKVIDTKAKSRSRKLLN